MRLREGKRNIEKQRERERAREGTDKVENSSNVDT